MLKRATPLELPTVLWRAFSGKAATVARHRQIEAFTGRDRGDASRPSTTAPFPVQVDGDYIGSFESVRYGVAPGALAVVS